MSFVCQEEPAVCGLECVDFLFDLSEVLQKLYCHDLKMILLNSVRLKAVHVFRHFYHFFHIVVSMLAVVFQSIYSTMRLQLLFLVQLVATICARFFA